MSENDRPLNVYDFLPDWAPPLEGAASADELLAAIDGLADLLFKPCECGCGRLVQGGHMEAAHPEDYRHE
jgi:hypothetical protein